MGEVAQPLDEAGQIGASEVSGRLCGSRRGRPLLDDPKEHEVIRIISGGFDLTGKPLGPLDGGDHACSGHALESGLDAAGNGELETRDWRHGVRTTE